MPTRAGFATVLVALGALLAGRVFGIFEMYIIAAAMLALVGCAALWVFLNWQALAVSRSVQPQRLHAGGSSTVTLQLTNGRMLPTPVARITDRVDGVVRADAQVPPIARYATTRASYRVPTERRGVIAIGPMRTQVSDPFGLASTSRSSAQDVELLVLPAVDRIPPPPPPGGTTAVRLDRTPNRVGSSGEEFSSLRPYVMGDDLRKVHWPSTARTGELVVRNEHLPEHGHSLIVLDVRAHVADEDTFERMVSAAASVAIACFDRGDDVTLMTTDGDEISASNQANFDRILNSLAVVDQVDDPHVSLPHRPGGTKSGSVLIAGSDIERLITALSDTSGGGRGSFVVRFHDEGARTTTAGGGLRSTRMIEVRHDDSFAAAWAATAGVAGARAL